ncbi:ribonuclease P protein subunit p29 isoform X1 [Prorops nasuta]|uniref:ribonuclease P protein subunit p29 isoform X1 n=1 Tax=Prorops nasuta TaxID=863751 RepID=UPI0034CE6A9B
MATLCANSSQYIINFLEDLLPASDTNQVAEKLKKSFIFSKLRLKHEKTRRKKKAKYLSARRRQHLGLNKIGWKNSLKYSDLLPLNKLWIEYMEQMFGNKVFLDFPKEPTHPSWDNLNQQLMKADFHGALITIVKSRCPSLTGKSGIVVQDTKNTFRICNANDTVITIPKNIVIIKLYLPYNVTLQILGRQLAIRPAERTVKKCKIPKSFQL